MRSIPLGLEVVHTFSLETFTGIEGYADKLGVHHIAINLASPQDRPTDQWHAFGVPLDTELILDDFSPLLEETELEYPLRFLFDTKPAKPGESQQGDDLHADTRQIVASNEPVVMSEYMCVLDPETGLLRALTVSEAEELVRAKLWQVNDCSIGFFEILGITFFRPTAGEAVLSNGHVHRGVVNPLDVPLKRSNVKLFEKK